MRRIRSSLFTVAIIFSTFPVLGGDNSELVALLDQAQQAEKQGQLVDPADSSALALYRQVLSQQKGQYLAWMGMMRMTDRFLRNASLAVTEQDSAAASGSLNSAMQIMTVLGPISSHAPESEADTLTFYQTRYLYLKDRVRKEKRHWQVNKATDNASHTSAKNGNSSAPQNTASQHSSSNRPLHTTSDSPSDARKRLTQRSEGASPAFDSETLTPFVGRTLDISTAALKSKSPELQHRLRQVALAAREQQAFLLIVAPTDRAGRWMYDVMKKSVSGYRLRGNIQRGKPRIELQEP